MKTLTNNQKSIIDAIKKEFIRINETKEEKREFNLINVDSLKQINDEIRRNKEEAEAIKNHWEKLAMDEAERIASLLQQDLPMACVERFGKSNGKIDLPSVIIQRQSGICGHHENYVDFDVRGKMGKHIEQSHGCRYQECVGLEYYYNGLAYNSIEELFAESRIADEIRSKIIK